MKEVLFEAKPNRSQCSRNKKCPMKRRSGRYVRCITNICVLFYPKAKECK